ncbi:UNVERIFIED_CONTAM: hypothetical protein FKN15_002054 [Acipenser sinensis]
MVVTVNRDLFGIGYLVNSADLSVGSAGCSATSSHSVASMVLFSILLQDCGSSFQVFPDFLSYTNHLYDKPASVGIIARVNIADILLECRYPRVQASAAVIDNWSGPRVSSVIYLGDVLHIEASVAIDNHVPLRLYVDSCITTLSNSKDSEPRYAVVDKLGWPGPQSACKGDHHRPPDVVHVARDHAVVLSKDSQYHPLQLVEVHDSGSSVSVLAVFTVAQALVCCPVDPSVSPVSDSGSSVPVLAVSTVAQALVHCPIDPSVADSGSSVSVLVVFTVAQTLVRCPVDPSVSPVSDSGSSVSVLAVFTVAQALVCCPVDPSVSPVADSGSSVSVLAVFTVAQALVCCPVDPSVSPVADSGSSVSVLAVFTVAQALVRCPVGRVP